MSLSLDIQRASAAADQPTDGAFQRWAEAALEQVEPAEMTIRLVDETEGRQLNREYRQRDYATNVLSFPNQAPAEFADGLLGDLVICAPVVLREAAEQHKTPDAHWAHLTIHGTLHLQGHDHIQTDEAEIMEALERQILHRLGYSDPYEPSGTAGSTHPTPAES